MRCQSCGSDVPELFDHNRGGTVRRLCRSCFEKEHDGEHCRCKDTIGKTPEEIGKMVLEDLKFWKK